ncbi:hypothetical protein CP358_01320 [Lactobacillus sp. UMNPBX7]|nr:hypothetical protein CP364_01155 [Lactobacillus sp. UMNPBX13]PEH01441.1 hypothetical protein CP358_01320 [Lactobacillus sp. UMNPBX7]
MEAKAKKVEAKNNPGFHPILSFCLILTHFVSLLEAKMEAKTTCENFERFLESESTRPNAYSANVFS